MSCELIERVSLLIDGELPPAELHEVERHLLTCAECRQARLDFINLRQQITAYPVLVDMHAQRRALAEILAARGHAPRPAPVWGERLRAAFAAPRLSPAWAAAFALLLVACAVAFFAYRNAQRNTAIANAPTNNNATERTPQVVAPVAPTPAEQIANHEVAAAQPAPSNVQTPRATGEGARQRERRRVTFEASAGTKLARERRAAPPRVAPPERESGPEFIAANATAAELAHARPADTETLTARHVEQSELLLRAFRNARVAERDAASDLAYERRRAQQLLYANIVLRREAAASGNVEVATLLDSLEPILLDIANLPDSPQAEDVRAIKERVERKNLVALLQVNSTTLARAYE